MILKSLHLDNFRNIAFTTLTPDPVFNIFWGENAQGKTNLLEAIYLLGTLKSFRSSQNEDLIRNGTERSLIRGETISAGVANTLLIGIDSKGKQAQLNGKKVTRPESFFRCLRPILFAPEEVALVKGAPAGRRNLIDRAIFQTYPAYLFLAQDFDRILRQRNRLLKEQRTERELEPWTASLVRSGALIRHQRFLFVQRLLPYFHKIYHQICGQRETANLVYHEGGSNLEKLEEELTLSFSQQTELERRTGITMVGPHRDDPHFIVDGLPVRQFASQGQQRSCLLAFKTAQILDLEALTGESPILLLDDLTGELDHNRQEFFFRFLLARKGQVFMTTTDLQPLLKEGFNQARTFHIQAGSLEPA